jgi:uncharacterized short protein YbdD (DUF466 family)
MLKARKQIVDVARTLWMRIREWCGDAAYERYQRVATRKNGVCVVTREQFYVEQLERRYSRPNRCC